MLWEGESRGGKGQHGFSQELEVGINGDVLGGGEY